MAIRTGERLGPYEILSAIGAGGMGEVYRAHDGRLNRDVALKVLPEVFATDPDRMARFEREARVLGALNHPNIATIYGLEEFESGRALVMELVDGPTLADRIAKGPIPLDETLPIAKQVAEALEYAHDRGVIHRDLKPANIKVTSDGTVKVLDFGLAKALMDEPVAADPRDSPTLSMAPTMTGVILGTTAYMSPEQAKGKPVDRRADLWAFGVVLYEMLTGKPLYSAETAAETLAFVMTKEPTFDGLPSTTPAGVSNLLRRCLEKNPRQRLQHIGEARIVIEGVLSGAAPAFQPVAAQRQHNLARFVAALAAALLVALAGTYFFIHFRQTRPQERSIRFEIAPPEKTALSMFRLSPDGRYLAFTALGGGRSQLWLRSLDSLQAQALQGTDDASYPFWSPDSSYIGFFAQGRLKEISVTGGPPQTLCEAPAGRGATWNNDGVLLFAPNLTGGLYRVSAAGGVPVAETKLTTSGSSDSQRYPEFILGSGYYLYTYQTEKAETTGIYVGSLGGKPPVRLLPDSSNAIYVPPLAPSQRGHLLFRRGNSLMAQPFDPNRLQTTGDMFPIAEQVGVSLQAGNGAFSASDSGLLAYRIGGTVGNRELIWSDREGRRISTVTKPAEISSEALSPDEKEIAVSISGSSGLIDLWLQETGRGVMSRFTFESGISAAPIWSKDGSRLVFSFRPGVSLNFTLVQKAVSGTGKEELLWHAGLNGYPWDWSPDGKFIVYSDYADKTNYDLWLLPLAGEHKPVPYLQTPFNEAHGQFSPDGRWMAYASDESGHTEVYVQTIPVGGGKWQISTSGGDYPRWRRDGKELYYITADGKLTVVPVKTRNASSSAFEAGPSQPLFGIEPLGNLIISRYPYQPAADGQRFLVNVPSGGEGAGATPITMVLNWQAVLNK